MKTSSTSIACGTPRACAAHSRLAADKAGWSKPLAAGHYQGLACFGCFNSYMAEVVEISVENDQPRVHRVVAAIDCGQVVNPNILEQQIQGGVIYALTNALRGQITIDKGRVVQGNFDDYAPIRMNEAPRGRGLFCAKHGSSHRRRRATGSAPGARAVQCNFRRDQETD